MDNNGFIGMVKQAFIKYENNPVFTDFEGETLTYKEVAKKIYKIHNLFRECGIKKGDRIALIGRNMSNFGISYLATITYGAVIVPILNEFGSNEIHHIINHSKSKLLFTTDIIFNKIDESKISGVKGIIDFVTFKPLLCAKDNIKDIVNKLEEKDDENFDVSKLSFAETGSEDLLVLSYTSGTSGFSKGVMLPHRSIWSNVLYAQEKIDMGVGDRIVSFLPLAHAYGCLFDFLWPFTEGVHITFLSRSPTPAIIAKAFSKVKPTLILSVPLVIEKIFKKKIAPALEKKSLKTLTKLPIINKLVYGKIRKKLYEVFGGEFRQIIIGGAMFNKDVEAFFNKIKFPVTVGYGMTECGPLISYAHSEETKITSAGKLVDRMEIRIDSSDPYNKVGEIQVKGDNVMLGYYKNQEATEVVFTNDGWLKTGDLGILDKENFVFIRGRSKNMILSANGQNIYPEEIEAKLSNLDYVQECLVRDMGEGKIEALVVPDYELADANSLNDKQIEEKIASLKDELNAELPKYMNVHKVTLFPEEFEKTPKKSIKRYKYMR